MSKIVLNNDTEFQMAFGGPVSITENVVFLVNVIESDVDSVHNAFKNPENTSTLKIYFIDDDPNAIPEVYTGYTRYCGFSVDNEGAILVELKKNLGV